jgi:hypothetical protein
VQGFVQIEWFSGILERYLFDIIPPLFKLVGQKQDVHMLNANLFWLMPARGMFHSWTTQLQKSLEFYEE